MRILSWVFPLLVAATASSAAAQQLTTCRSAVIVPVDDGSVRAELENDRVALAGAHRYDAVSGHASVRDISGITDNVDAVTPATRNAMAYRRYPSDSSR